MFAVLLVVAYDKFGFDQPLPFMLQFNYANDNGQEILLLAPITDDVNAGATYSTNGRVMLFGQYRFK